MATKRINTYSVIQPAANTSALGVDSSDNTVLLDMSDVALLADVTAAVAAAAAPPGVLQAYAGSTPPTGWLLCDGSAVSRTTYSELFSAIGTTWGIGDNSTTFNLPDGRGAVLRGTGTGTVNGRDKVGPAVGDKQEDQMQRITGKIGDDSGSGLRMGDDGEVSNTEEGALKTTTGASSGRESGSRSSFGSIAFDSANSPGARVPDETAIADPADTETRPYSIGVQWIIKT